MRILLLLSLIMLSACSNKVQHPPFSECSASLPPTLSGNVAQDNILLVKAWKTQTDIIASCKMQIDYYKLKGR